MKTNTAIPLTRSVDLGLAGAPSDMVSCFSMLGLSFSLLIGLSTIRFNLIVEDLFYFLPFITKAVGFLE